ncbi:hypothetical protein GQ43DRAFT_414482 [Delitschia confertaspora ATCC 74209]|uniref:Rhodopsin domain-containing protein n=1 Tax=Delitschia confertaspora ATCC 74209 TaxID=1513339 RepID=A0A9P4MQP7_9PLEO|nr:hypothetical protein GQ43DRAFT_414482 [Delitschia confertaspora ATCC 74209]
MAPANYAPILNGVMWTQVVIAIVFIAARIYTRRIVINSVGWDDMLMLVNLVTFILYVAFISVGTSYGIGKKYAAVPAADYSKAIMWEALGQAICILGIAASKGSVALFLLRIVLKTWHIVLLWFCIVTTTILAIITTTLLFLQCKPAAFLWDHTIEGGVCWLNFTAVGLTMASWSAFMDFVLALLPWHVVWSLNMKKKEKLTVTFGLSLGIFAGVCSIIRTYELKSLSSLDEYVYDTVPMLIWSSTEVLMTIMCACIPVLRPLYIRLVYGSQYEGSGPRSKSYQLHDRDRSQSKGKSKPKSGSNSNIYMGPGSSALRTTIKGYDDDNMSEESILRETQEQQRMTSGEAFKAGDIVRTDEIHVSYVNDSVI